MKAATLDALLRERDRSDPVVLATDLGSGEARIVRPFASAPAGEGGGGPAAVDVAGDGRDDPLAAAARDAVLADRSRVVETDGGRIFLHVFNPPVRVVVVGAVHIAQQLCAMAARAGYVVSVVDPRRAFATAERFPDTDLVRSWPAEALAALGLDRRTAVVTVTHDPKLDDPALQAALESDVFYIGALGSRRTHDKRLARLREAGFDEDALGRIHAPVGLDIGARTPGEIAASVLAQIVQVLRAPR